jgi:hypothetical protein
LLGLDVAFDPGTSYPGTCLDPAYFTEGAVFPPEAINASNSSVTYCLGSFPAPRKLGKALTFCHNDPLTIMEREAFCAHGTLRTLVSTTRTL